MKPLLLIKTLYRSPIKTLLTFILLAVVTFAFFSQTAEYAITAREINNAAKQYCGVGSAEIAPPADSYPGVPVYIDADPRIAQIYPEALKEAKLNKLRYQPLTQEKINVISALPYITSIDTRYMTAGISDTYYRLDDAEYFYNYTARCVIEGTLTEVRYGDTGSNSVSSYNKLILNDCKLLAGKPPSWAVGQETLAIYADPLTYDENGGGSLGVGLVRISMIHGSNYIYGTEYVQNLTPGSRYVFVVRFEPLSTQNIFDLSDLLTNPWCDAVQLIDARSDNYLDTEAFAPLRELIEITNADIHTFDMVYTDDMRAIMRFDEGDMVILDGRALKKEDSTSDPNVCVVSREFAEANNLGVGDTITMKLGTELFEQYKGLGAVAVTRERYKPADKTVELEIVGIYTDTDSPNKQSNKPNWSYSINTVFVPKSLLPVDADALSGHVFSPAEFSFKVENAWDIPAFLEESAPKFEGMGLKLIFNDDNWPDIAQGFQAARQISLIKIIALLAAVAVATGFVVYLLINRKKKEYAVMRALGTTKRVAARSLLLPLTSVTVLAVLAGSAAGWIYTIKTVAHDNTLSLLKEYSVCTSVPAGAVIGCILGEILLTLLIATLLLGRIGNLSPLSLLQERGYRRTRARNRPGIKKSTTLDVLPTSVVPSMPRISTPVQSTAPAKLRRKSGSPGFALRYIWKRIRRAAGKSALSILLAALLFGAIGQLALVKQQYTQLCADTVITARFVGGLPLTAVPQIKNSDYVKNPYYEVRETVDLNASETTIMVFTNDIARYTDEVADITYADGYDTAVLDTSGKTIVAGKTLLKKYGLKPGDKVAIAPKGLFANLVKQTISFYRIEHPESHLTDEEIQTQSHDEITRMASSATRTYTIAGVVTTPSGRYDDMAFSPGDYEASTVVGKTVKLDVAEFTLADNFLADEFRSLGEKVAGGSATSGVAFVMDTSKMEHLKNATRLLETMYPIAMTAALLIGGFLCCLVIVQSSREAAIMRVLGTTKRKTRAILALEQIILSIAGLALSACGLLLFKGPALMVISGQLALFAALYFAVVLASAVVSSVLATRRNVLELLQTKE